MHTLRINVMHSKEPFGSMETEIAELAPKAGNVLLAAILYLLSIDPPWEFPSHVLTNALPLRIMVKARIICENIEDALIDHIDPHFEAEHDLLAFTSDRLASGKTTMKITTHLTAVIGPKAKFNVYGWGIEGEGKGDFSIDEVTA
jgi:hypothetical protein